MPPDGHRRLLVVDDEPEVCATLATYLGNAGYTVETAPTAPEALDKLPGDFHALVTDIRLPDTDGFALIQEARQLKPDLGVFLITGYPSIETIMQAKREGVVAYFPKPVQLEDMEAKLRAFLGESRLLDGPLLVIGTGLFERLRDKLVRFEAQCCPEDEATFLQIVATHNPKAILAEAGADTTVPLLRAYHTAAKTERCPFLVVTEPASVTILPRLVFDEGVADCVAADAARPEIERVISEAVRRRDADRQADHDRLDQLIGKCEQARPYRNGYFCLAPEQCPSPGDWIAVNGNEVRRCARRPLVFESLEQVGFATWSGRVDASRTPEMRDRLLALLTDGIQDIVIDAQGLTEMHYNLLEILADVAAELRKRAPDGRVHVVNLADPVLEQFRKTPVLGVRFSGARMIDVASTFARWGTRFE